MVDGARNAFLGYLYQLIGTASVVVQDVPSADDAWVRLLARVESGVVVSEEFGQDAVVHPLRPEDGLTAIQFKHSSKLDGVIDRNELIQILSAFDRSREMAAAAGDEVGRYVLVTNRRLEARAQAIVDCKTSSEPHRSLRVATKRGGGNPIAGNVSLLKRYNGDAEAAATAWHGIVRSLEVFVRETFEVAFDNLRKFAARYGVLDREWDDCLKSLVGAFVCETSDGKSVQVTPEWLKEHLVGDSGAANLHFGSSFKPHIADHCQDKLDQRIGLQHSIPADFHLNREVQRKLHSELEQFPVVFVLGKGGCGKSLVVARYLRSVARDRLVWSEGALTARESDIVRLITTARLPRGFHKGSDYSFRDLRDRLIAANGAGHPLLLLDLDGIDEAPNRIREIRELIATCWANGSLRDSPASVVATCRSGTSGRPRDEIISLWMDTPLPKMAKDRVGFVELDDFVGQELVDAARLLNGDPERRIIYSESPNDDGLIQPYQPVGREILQSLRHPVVWGEYASMEESHRDRVLNGDSASLNDLAEALLSRFLQRCRSRENWKDLRMIEDALARVATRYGPLNMSPYSNAAWDEVCAPMIGTSESNLLYSECLSYGIISRDAAATWRWSHRFLVEHLAGLA